MGDEVHSACSVSSSVAGGGTGGKHPLSHLARKRELKGLEEAESLGYRAAMNTVIDLGKLTRAEKLRAMEELWEDLTRSAEDYPSPDWHGDVLRDRDEAFKAGKDEFVPWEEAKRELRERRK